MDRVEGRCVCVLLSFFFFFFFGWGGVEVDLNLIHLTTDLLTQGLQIKRKSETKKNNRGNEEACSYAHTCVVLNYTETHLTTTGDIQKHIICKPNRNRKVK